MGQSSTAVGPHPAPEPKCSKEVQVRETKHLSPFPRILQALSFRAEKSQLFQKQFPYLMGIKLQAMSTVFLSLLMPLSDDEVYFP